MISVVTDIEEFDHLDQQWNELFELSSNATPYQGFLFNKITWNVWKRPTDQLYIICYSQSEGAKYEAIIPCYINENKELHLIDFMSDFCDGIIVDESAEKYSMYKEITNHILLDPEIKRLCFNNLRADSRMLAYLYAFGGYTSVHSLTGYSVLRMTPQENDSSFIASLRSCNRYQRTKLRGQFKDSLSLKFQELKEPEDFPESDIKIIAEHMIEEHIRTKEYFDTRFFEYFKCLYNAGLLSILTHKNDDEPLAANLILHDAKANEKILWITLYKNKKDNSNLILSTLNMMYQEGITNFNFARGMYQYKLTNFHPEIFTLNQLRIYKSRQGMLKANLREAFQKEFQYLRQQVYLKLADIKHKLVRR